MPQFTFTNHIPPLPHTPHTTIYATPYILYPSHTTYMYTIHVYVCHIPHVPMFIVSVHIQVYTHTGLYPRHMCVCPHATTLMHIPTLHADMHTQIHKHTKVAQLCLPHTLRCLHHASHTHVDLSRKWQFLSQSSEAWPQPFPGSMELSPPYG